MLNGPTSPARTSNFRDILARSATGKASSCSLLYLPVDSCNVQLPSPVTIRGALVGGFDVVYNPMQIQAKNKKQHVETQRKTSNSTHLKTLQVDKKTA